MNSKRTLTWWNGLAIGGGLMVALTGCGSSQGPKAKTVASDDAVAGAGADPMSVVNAAPKQPERKVSEEEREDFEKALATYQDLKKDGKLDGSDCDKAATAFRKASERNPKLREAKYNEAAVAMECGRENEAVRTYEQLANGAPPYAPAITSLGFIAFRKGNTDEAERMFVRAIDLDKGLNSVAARNNLSQILRGKIQRSGGNERTQLVNQATNHLRSVLALDGNNIQAYATLAALYNDIGYLEMARLVGQQAIKRADEIATGRIDEGDSKANKEGGDKSEKASKEVKVEGTGYTTEMRKQLALVYNTLGLVDLRRKNVTGAIANFRKGIDMDPGLNEARMNLAAVSLNFRDYKTAEENFRAVLGAQPNNFEATIGLGVALRGNKKFEESEAQYLAAQKLNPNSPEPLYNLGLLYQDYRGGERTALQKAQAYYREFLGKSGTVPAKLRKDAEKRIKDIDEMFKALDEAEKLQREAEEMQRKAEEQQKKMEEEMKKQEAAEKAAKP